MAKCASSAMTHLGRQRNANEMFGAYGHDLTYDQMKWLTDWVLVRGQNLIIPHAFYYSTRGPRIDERPPDVGPHSPWWNDYRDYADYVRRVCYLNATGQQVCHVAVLAGASHLPDRLVKPLYEHQFDFNYLQDTHLRNDARVDEDGIHIAGAHYRVLLIDEAVTVGDDLRPQLDLLDAAGRVVWWSADRTTPPKGRTRCASDEELIAQLDRCVPHTIQVSPPTPHLRSRHIIYDEADWFFLTNEGPAPLTFQVALGTAANHVELIDPYTRNSRRVEASPEVTVQRCTTLLLRVLGA